MALRQLYSPAQRLKLQMCSLLIVLFLLGFAAIIPFVWESTSVWYKAGSDRMLLQIAKVSGLLAAVLIFVQIVLAQRLVPLDRTFGLDRVYRLHRYNGLLLLVLAIVHALLVLIPEGIDNLPIGLKFLPEMLGAFMLVFLLFLVAIAYRRPPRLAYHLWRRAHGPAGFMLAGILAVHIFYVSDSFESGIPRLALWMLIALVMLICLFARLQRWQGAISTIPVHSCRLAGKNIIGLQLAVPAPLAYAPGQFAFLQLHGEKVASEWHPFTIASAPTTVATSDDKVEFYIRQCGDWTRSIAPGGSLQATLQGPYGLFSYKARPLPSMLIFIGGGIGITPLLSMLRQLSRENSRLPTILIWSLACKKEMFLGQELQELGSRLPAHKTHIRYTREEGGSRVNREDLRTFLDNVPLSSHFYICGRVEMMQQVRQDLLKLGFDSKAIFSEHFAL